MANNENVAVRAGRAVVDANSLSGQTFDGAAMGGMVGAGLGLMVENQPTAEAAEIARRSLEFMSGSHINPGETVQYIAAGAEYAVPLTVFAFWSNSLASRANRAQSDGEYGVAVAYRLGSVATGVAAGGALLGRHALEYVHDGRGVWVMGIAGLFALGRCVIDTFRGAE